MTQIKTKIPAELEPAAVGGMVTDSKYVKDRVKNKTQEEVNADTEERVSTLEESVGTGGSVDERIAEEGAKHYLKTETYSKTELNNMITTPNQEYVTVTATDQTTAVTDVLPATGSADTVYRVGSWNGTQYEEGVYSEYSWNGSTYIHLSTKTEAGEVYDISAAHATGGELATYDDLADALGTNGANIPQSLRKGGMSVKFVQSDNNYTQFRCIADEFTTDTNNWVISEEGRIIKDPEFAEVKLDKNGRILEATYKDGRKLFSAGLKVSGEIECNSAVFTTISEPEFSYVVLDKANRILFGVRKEDGNFLFGCGIPKQIKEFIVQYISGYWDINPEFIEVVKDINGSIISGRLPDGTLFENVGFKTPLIELNGNTIKTIDDTEDRIETIMDKNGKILSYRKGDGTKVENAGIEFSKEALQKFMATLDSAIKNKKWYLPKFGKVNIKQETFYLDKGDWNSYSDDVILIQMYDNNDANAVKKLTLSTFYIKSTLNPLPGGGYDRTSVTNSSVSLELHAGKDVVAVGDKYFAINLYIPVMNGDAIVDYNKVKASKIIDPVSGDITGYEYNGNSTEVKQVIDTPPYYAWKVTKSIEHYCVADIDFGYFYSKLNDCVSIKFQGSSTLMAKKKGLRITFYKNNSYSKKDKVKVGEMIRLSGFNMKAYHDNDRNVNDPIVSNTMIEVWETRKEDCYPWNKTSVPYNGATGFIKSFPIETWWGTEFYGIQYFGLKKDEKNYMLDGDDDASGIFVSGDVHGDWSNANPRQWVDEMGVDGRELAYPDWEDSVSVETAAALSELFKRTKGFVDGTIEIDGVVTDFTNDMLEEYIDLKNWIDYYIGFQVMQLWDNTFHNVILYSGSDKKKFYLFYYDVDQTLVGNYDENIFDICSNRGVPTVFWQKFAEEYKDSIINRYAELRKSVLTYENIYSIFENYISGIPRQIVNMEVRRWGAGDPLGFVGVLNKLKKRFDYLDSTYLMFNN